MTPGTRLAAGLLAFATAGCAPASGAAPAPPAATHQPRVAATPQTLPRSAPTRLRIPAIDVDSGLVPLGQRADGTMEVPAAGFPAGWYTGGPAPGERGPAVLAGHVDWGGRAGVFARLERLAPGDGVVITRVDGSVVTFEVTRVERLAKDVFPTDRVYGDLDHAGLRLITCGGSFDRAARSYVDNVVVFAQARRVTPSRAAASRPPTPGPTTAPPPPPSR